MESTKSISPFHPVSIFNLFLFPGKFFRSGVVFARDSLPLIAIAMYGGLYAISRIEKSLMRIEMGSPRQTDLIVQEWLAGSWLNFWLYVMLGAVLGGFFYWWVGGWWFKIRARWSGAVDPDPTLARRLYAYASLVVSLPTLAFTVLQVPFFADYMNASNGVGALGCLPPVFTFWVLFTWYSAVRATFEVETWKAIFWFIALPGGVYALGYALLIFAIMII